KSCPGLTDLAAVTAQRTTVSPRVASTAPSAWRATRPVSSLKVYPPHSISTVFVLNILFPSPAGRMPAGQLGQANRPAAVRGLETPLRPTAELRLAPMREG